jgi:hypothetical protein
MLLDGSEDYQKVKIPLDLFVQVANHVQEENYGGEKTTKLIAKLLRSAIKHKWSKARKD